MLGYYIYAHGNNFKRFANSKEYPPFIDLLIRCWDEHIEQVKVGGIFT